LLPMKPAVPTSCALARARKQASWLARATADGERGAYGRGRRGGESVGGEGVDGGGSSKVTRRRLDERIVGGGLRSAARRLEPGEGWGLGGAVDLSPRVWGGRAGTGGAVVAMVLGRRLGAGIATGGPSTDKATVAGAGRMAATRWSGGGAWGVGCWGRET
jgi:hypothetical protein